MYLTFFIRYSFLGCFDLHSSLFLISDRCIGIARLRRSLFLGNIRAGLCCLLIRGIFSILNDRVTPFNFRLPLNEVMNGLGFSYNT